MGRRALGTAVFSERNADSDGEFEGGMFKAKKRREMFITHLKFLRKSIGLTLEGLSEITGISISYLSRLESGSRRLNTDLISRLSKAFGCDPAELLQDYADSPNGMAVPSSNYVPVSSRYLSKGALGGVRSKSMLETRADMPVYEISCLQRGGLSIQPVSGEFRFRPVEFVNHSDAIVVRTDGYLYPQFNKTSLIYAMPNYNLLPEAMVLVVLSDDSIIFRKVWSITPNTIQLCAFDKIDLLKSGKCDSSPVKYGLEDSPFGCSDDKVLIEVNRSSIKEVYAIAGHMDTSLV